MLEKPGLDDQRLITCLQVDFGLQVSNLAFLPLGADVNTAVYRACVGSGEAYFVKLRKGDFNEITVALPEFLHSNGVTGVIAPLRTCGGKLWSQAADFRVVVYPFIDGKDNYQVSLSDHQWLEFGATLSRIHALPLPPDLQALIPVETFTPRFRNQVRKILAFIDGKLFPDPVAHEMARVLRLQRDSISEALDRADELAGLLKSRNLRFVPCHSDIHPGNLHITPDGRLYIVDWDTSVYAPRERDLMLIGGCSTWSDPQAVDLFYQGYGDIEINWAALTYYRYERMIQDIAAFSDQLLLSEEGGADREMHLGYFKSIFYPGHELDLAQQADDQLRIK